MLTKTVAVAAAASLMIAAPVTAFAPSKTPALFTSPRSAASLCSMESCRSSTARSALLTLRAQLQGTGNKGTSAPNSRSLLHQIRLDENMYPLAGV